MSQTVRCSISLDSDLLERFDGYCRQGNFETRSAAISQLLRESLTSQSWQADGDDVAATVTLVYDHHNTRLTKRLMHIQHDHTNVIVSTMHVHLNHDLCLEVIILRGRAAELRELSSALRGLKGVRQGQVVVATADKTP